MTEGGPPGHRRPRTGKRRSPFQISICGDVWEGVSNAVIWKESVPQATEEHPVTPLNPDN
jgi:hypothetical protein